MSQILIYGILEAAYVFNEIQRSVRFLSTSRVCYQ